MNIRLARGAALAAVIALSIGVARAYAHFGTRQTGPDRRGARRRPHPGWRSRHDRFYREGETRWHP